MTVGVSPPTERALREIAGEILALDLPHPTRVGVDGFCAAGKTTLADELGALLNAAGVDTIRVSTDDFQNPPEIRWQLGEASPEGFYRHAVDFAALDREVLVPLGPDGSRRYRTSVYDIFALRPDVSERREAPDDAVLILDGLFLHAPAVLRSLDYTVFISTPFETCIDRALTRNQERKGDGAEVEELYRTRYVPGFQLYFAECRPDERASATVPNG